MEYYVLKNSQTEAVIKVYETANSGGTSDIALSALAENGETVTDAYIKEIMWSCKPNKSVHLSRLSGAEEEGTYYLANVGNWHFLNFHDETYSTLPFRFVFDGQGTVIIRVRKIVA